MSIFMGDKPHTYQVIFWELFSRTSQKCFIWNKGTLEVFCL